MSEKIFIGENISHSTLREINRWLDSINHFPLECDGMTRAISTLLSINNIEHTVHIGHLMSSDGVNGINHYWIQLNDEYIIDMRARMWMGSNAPHGLFLNSGSSCIYSTSHKKDDLKLDPYLFSFITGSKIDNIEPFPLHAIEYIKNPVHPSLVDTLVADNNGNPLRVYRGEHGPISDETPVFNTNIASISFGNCAVANQYATKPNDKTLWDSNKSQPRIIPCYLSIKNPIFITDVYSSAYIDYIDLAEIMGTAEATKAFLRIKDDVENTNQFDELSKEYNVCSLDELINVNPRCLAGLYAHTYRLLDDHEFVEWCVNNGYDGAIYSGSGESMDTVEYRIFKPEQAVLALSHGTDPREKLENAHVCDNGLKKRKNKIVLKNDPSIDF